MVSQDEYSGVCVLSVQGELSGDDCAVLRKLAEEAIEARHVVNFVVDLQKTPFIDSEGLETLVGLKARCDELFGLFRLASPDDTCRKILEITRLDRRFEIETDLTSAVKAMR
ncbi:MAG: STAS domain-containing protein [Tepidisphaeraceae bacterium]